MFYSCIQSHLPSKTKEPEVPPEEAATCTSLFQKIRLVKFQQLLAIHERDLHSGVHVLGKIPGLHQASSKSATLGDWVKTIAQTATEKQPL